MHKRNNQFNKDPGGYRVAWLILLETVTFNSMLLIGLRYSFWLGSLLFVPFFYILSKVVSHEPKEVSDSTRYQLDFDAAIHDETLKFPVYADYLTVIAKESSKTSSHRQRITSPKLRTLPRPTDLVSV